MSGIARSAKNTKNAKNAKNTGSAVCAEKLSICYGQTVAVDEVSFEANSGQITVLLGPNGAGKTSTIEHLEGYRPASSGSSSVLGLDPIRDHQQLTSSVGIMLQQGGIPTAIRPKELLKQYAGFFPHSLDPEDLLQRVGLAKRSKTPYRRLSGGEQQRLSLALALIGQPQVVFLDEPTAGVDLEGRDLIRSLLVELRSEGVCVLITTHDLAEAERLADKVVIIDHGRVVASGTPAELMASSSSDHLLFGATPNLDCEALGQTLGAKVVEITHGEYRVDSPPSPELVASVTSWLAEQNVQLTDLRAERQRLDDVFRRLTNSTSTADSTSTTDSTSP
ncbi:MAG: ABC transporter ATP-binding protein [Microthrixaceae bacterium]